MTSVKRFYFVKPPTRGKAHIMYASTKVEGNLTLCGRRVIAGWKWSTRPKFRDRCTQCEAAAC